MVSCGYNLHNDRLSVNKPSLPCIMVSSSIIEKNLKDHFAKNTSAIMVSFSPYLKGIFTHFSKIQNTLYLQAKCEFFH